MKSSPFAPSFLFYLFFFQNTLTYIASSSCSCSFLSFVISISPHGTRAIPKLATRFSLLLLLLPNLVPPLGLEQRRRQAHFTPFHHPLLFSERYFVNCAQAGRRGGSRPRKRSARRKAARLRQTRTIYPICPKLFARTPHLLRHLLSPQIRLFQVGGNRDFCCRCIEWRVGLSLS